MIDIGWFIDAPNRMTKRIKNGEYPIDVINDMSNEFKDGMDGEYESFAFARDSLDRKAWKLSVRYRNENDPITESHTNNNNNWYVYKTKFLVDCVKDGFDQDEVLNKLAREFANYFNFDYGAFEFGFDGFARRLWEINMYNTEKIYPEKSKIRKYINVLNKH